MALKFKAFGSGDPIIILHGLFGTLDNWQTMAKRLANDFTVFIIDQRNHGKSPHTDNISYPLMSEDLRLFMEDHWMYDAHIIGHSMGGKTAMQFALDNPDMVNKLIVVDIAPKAYVGNHESIFDALFAVPLETLESRGAATDILTSKLGEDPGTIQFLLKNLTREKEGGYNWKMNLPVLHKDYKNILATVKGAEAFEKDTLFIKGGKSDYISSSDMTMIQELFSNAKLQEVPEAGHWIHAEAPDALYKLLIDFLKN
ncbi:MAG: alpha/beta fold hydrolase [Saprospiraceae bacterium]